MSFLNTNFSTVASTADLNTDTAVTWTKGAGSFTYGGTIIADAANRVFGSDTNSGNDSAWYVAKSNTPATADYSVLSTIKYLSATGGSVAILARATDTSGGGAGNGYCVYVTPFGGIFLGKFVSGAFTSLGTINASSPSSDFTITLAVSGSSITGSVSGGLTGSVTATDTTYASAGYAGLYFTGTPHTATTGFHFTSITGTNAGGGGPAFIAASQRPILQAVNRANNY